MIHQYWTNRSTVAHNGTCYIFDHGLWEKFLLISRLACFTMTSDIEDLARGYGVLERCSLR